MPFARKRGMNSFALWKAADFELAFLEPPFVYGVFRNSFNGAVKRGSPRSKSYSNGNGVFRCRDGEERSAQF